MPFLHAWIQKTAPVPSFAASCDDFDSHGWDRHFICSSWRSCSTLWHLRVQSSWCTGVVSTPAHCSSPGSPGLGPAQRFAQWHRASVRTLRSNVCRQKRSASAHYHGTMPGISPASTSGIHSHCCWLAGIAPAGRHPGTTPGTDEASCLDIDMSTVLQQVSTHWGLVIPSTDCTQPRMDSGTKLGTTADRYMSVRRMHLQSTDSCQRLATRMCPVQAAWNDDAAHKHCAVPALAFSHRADSCIPACTHRSSIDATDHWASSPAELPSALDWPSHVRIAAHNLSQMWNDNASSWTEGPSLQCAFLSIHYAWPACRRFFRSFKVLPPQITNVMLATRFSIIPWAIRTLTLTPGDCWLRFISSISVRWCFSSSTCCAVIMETAPTLSKEDTEMLDIFKHLSPLLKKEKYPRPEGDRDTKKVKREDAQKEGTPEVMTLLRAMGQLLLRVDADQQAMKRQDSWICFMQTESQALLPSLILKATEWKTQQTETSSQPEQYQPLRCCLAQHLATTMLQRLHHLAQCGETDQLMILAKLHGVLTPDNQFPFQRWNPHTQGLRQTGQQPICLKRMIKYAEQLVEILKDPTVTIRFHSMKPPDNETVVPWLWQISMRADDLQVLLTTLQGSTMWSLLGMSMKAHTQGQSKPALLLRDLLGKGTGKSKSKGKTKSKHQTGWLHSMPLRQRPPGKHCSHVLLASSSPTMPTGAMWMPPLSRCYGRSWVLMRSDSNSGDHGHPNWLSSLWHIIMSLLICTPYLVSMRSSQHGKGLTPRVTQWNS